MARAQLVEDRRLQENPLDFIEEMVLEQYRPVQRHSDTEMTVDVRGHWCTYHLFFVWQPTVNAVFFSCHFDVRVSENRRCEIYELVGRANERMWIGHFDFLSDDATPIFRHTLSLHGLREPNMVLYEDLIDTALAECERFYPALHLLLWGGKSIEEALSISFMETAGEA
jgi:hypothetical protein